MNIKLVLFIVGILFCSKVNAQEGKRYQGPRYHFFDDFTDITHFEDKDSIVDVKKVIALEVSDNESFKRLSEYENLQYLSLVNIELDSRLEEFGERLEFIEIRKCQFNDYSFFERIKGKDLFSIRIEDTKVNDFSWLNLFKGIRVLHVEGSDLKVIPKELKRKTCLESINLSRNSITRLDLENFESKNLKYLYFRDNGLSVVMSTNVPSLNFEIIDLANNTLTKESVCRLESYNSKNIILDSCALDEFPTCLLNNCHLEKLSLENNFIENLPDILNRSDNCKELWILLFGNPLKYDSPSTKSNIVILSNETD